MWLAYEVVLLQFTTLDRLDFISLDDVDEMLLAKAAWDDAGRRMEKESR